MYQRRFPQFTPEENKIRILTLSSVFPTRTNPLFGLFVYERAKHISLKKEVRVLCGVPWSPFDGFIRKFKKNFRPASSGRNQFGELRVYYWPFFCFPGFLKFMDGCLYYLSLARRVNRLRKEYPFDMIDAHFAYPDGVAALLLSRKFKIPYSITLRGTEVPYSRSFYRKIQIKQVLKHAAEVICVSNSLAELAKKLGADEKRTRVIPNGIKSNTFLPHNKLEARRNLNIGEQEKVILSVGGLVKRKGFHRVIRLLPGLRKKIPSLLYIIVGGESIEGDYSYELEQLIEKLGLEKVVRFEGKQPPEKLPLYYSASDLFVLATSNEGWPNVIVESLACGTPVVATDVGGIKEIINRGGLGITVPFGDSTELAAGIENGLTRKWDRGWISQHMRSRTWDHVADEVIAVFEGMLPSGMDTNRGLPGHTCYQESVRKGH